MSAYGVAVRAARRAVSLPAIARDIGVHVVALLQRASPEPVHPAANEMQRRTHRHERLEYAGQGPLVVTVVQVPAIADVVGHPRVRRGLFEHCVDVFGASLGIGVIGDEGPFVEQLERLREVAVVHPEVDDDSGRLAPLDQSACRLWAAIGEVYGELHGVLAVRVEMHSTITSPRGVDVELRVDDRRNLDVFRRKSDLGTLLGGGRHPRKLLRRRFRSD